MHPRSLVSILLHSSLELPSDVSVDSAEAVTYGLKAVGDRT